MSRPLSSASSSSLQSGRVTPSASSALPETASYYRTSIEATKQAQQDHRYRATNALYRTPSGASIGSRQDATARQTPVDDAIADGLAETSERTREHDDVDNDIGFLPARDAKRTTGSILPSAAFFSPKRPPHSSSPISFPPPPGDATSRSATPHSSAVPTNSSAPPKRSGFNGTSGSEQDRFVQVGGGNGQTAAFNTVSSYDIGDVSHLGSQSGRSINGVHVISASSVIDDHSVRQQASRDGLLLASRGQEKCSARAGGATFSSSAAKGEKGHKVHKGANRFFLGGLIMTSDDNPLPFLLSMVIMIALPALWFVFEAPYTWHHISPAPVIVFAYVWAVALSSMCVTAWRDPGVLPRDLDPDPPCSAGDGGTFVTTSDPLAIPLPRIVRVRQTTDLKVKWCDTCGTYRPPRSSHCRVCDNCVENIDHHCTFLNTCIGRRNYFTFFAFLIFSILACFISIAFCVVHIVFLTFSTQTSLPRGDSFGEGKSFREALKATPLSVVIFFLSISVCIPIMTLFAYHVRLVCMNRTTVEQIRINATMTYSEKPSYDEEGGGGASQHVAASQRNACVRMCAACLPCFNFSTYRRDPNPFAYSSAIRNARASLLRPMTVESWINRYRHTVLDKRRPNPAS